ncbi:LOW QUALITY PROTEIN: mucin-5AC [Cottoperca gobio]|uniref:LOW QUALITY PROTEIN: mucin-5AC n=1 Tax=Cottoperca gobio TaxID=56716 RepID=A0A6J2QFZ3_COTGO|nr:LOW QUALITY PROTEIN: mucin-5AC-like [Cottoperca gobio]
MAGRRSCVNSLWSGTERVRIGERLKATLAGVLELELLRCKHLEMVDAARRTEFPLPPTPKSHERRRGGEPRRAPASEAEHGIATSRRQQAPSPSDIVVMPCQSSLEDCGSNSGDGTVHTSSGRGSNSRWSTLSWDAPSDLLSPPTPDPSGTVHLDSDSRPSSGFYSVSGSSLSDSCYSVSSDAAQGGSAPSARPLKLWEQVPLSADNTDTLWSDGAVQQQQPALQSSQEEAELTEGTPVSVQSDIEVPGLSFLSDLCSGLGDSLISSFLPLLEPTSSSSSSLHPNPQLDPRYCTDLVSRRTKEVYPYPSPLHAVALQSPIFTSQSQEQSASPNPEGLQLDEPQESNMDPTLPLQPTGLASFTQLEQYICRLARQYHSRVTSSTADLTSSATPGQVRHRGLCTPGKSHGSTQSLYAFESRSQHSTLPVGSITPCKSLLGNSARISLSTTGKKPTRNSINLGNLPSATGEDLNINLHLNLNLNLTPGLNSSRVDNPKNGSCGALRNDFASVSASSATSLSSATPAPALRARPRISTCPSSLSHRSSLEVTSGSGPSPGFGSSAFCRSLDWSNGAPPETAPPVFGSGSAPGSQRSSLIQESSSSPKISEDSPMVAEISRLSGLSKAVVVGLMEQGVELDIDCFQTDTAGEVRSHSKTHLTPTVQTDQSHDYTRLTDLNPQRPIQLSLSVTHSPQSQASLTPPLSHSSSPIHPYQSIHIPSSHFSSHCHYQQIPSPSDLPSSTASSPASRPTTRGRSPPRPLQPSPMGATPLSVFRRDAPFQCSLPRTNTRSTPLEQGGIQPRGGSLRQSGGGSGGWKRVEGEGLYSGKHATHKLIRAATVSSYAKREDHSSVWAEEQEMERSEAQTPRKTSNKLWRGFEGRRRFKESESEREEMDRAEYGYGWRSNSVGSWRREHRRVKGSSSSNDKRPKVENSPIFSKKRGKEEGERRSTSLRLSRRALFRSESQGLLVSRNHGEEPTRRAHWVSSLDVGQGGLSKHEGLRLLRAKEEDKRLSSTASLFNLSRSQSLEGSCHSLSPLSSPSFSPSPPPQMPLQRSRSLRDLGRRMFGSMRSLSLKRKPSKK